MSAFSTKCKRRFDGSSSNFSNLADWRATLLRVARFRKAIMKMDDLGQAKSRIQFSVEADPSIKIDDLHVASPVGCVMLSEPHANMNASERVLITGDNGEHKALLFRAIGGLWPWGSGQITHPGAQRHHVHAGPRLISRPAPFARPSPTPTAAQDYEASAIVRRSPQSDSSTSSPTSIRRTDGTGI